MVRDERERHWMPGRTTGGIVRTNVLKLWVVLMSVVAVGAAEIEIEGPQDGTYEKAEYLVAHDIIIEEGRTMAIEPGAVFRFRRNAGLVVKGALVCRGTPTEPIVFTSVNDRPDEAPQPFDWTGITVRKPSGSILLNYVKVSYSTFGVHVDYRKDALNIKNTVFTNNGDKNLSMLDSVIAVPDGRPYSFIGVDRSMVAADSARVSEGVNARRIARISLAGTAATGLVTAIVGFAGSQSAYNKYTETTDPEKAGDYKARDRALRAVGVTGTVLAVLSGIGLGLTFYF